MKNKHQKVPTPDGCRFELPNRQLGESRRAGIFIIAFCSFGAVLLLFWSTVWLFVGLHMFANVGVLGLAVAAVSLIGFAGMFFAIKFGTLGLFLWRDQTRCDVEIGVDHVYSIERFGIFNWRRKFPIQAIKRLAIERDAPGDSSGSSKLSLDPNLMTIRAEAEIKRFLIAPGYHHQILVPLIRELGDELNRLRAGADPIEVSEQISVAKKHWNEPENGTLKGSAAGSAAVDQVFQRPSNSKIEVYDYGGTDAYKIPPMGIWKGSKGLLGFSIAWNGFMVIFTTVFAVITIVGDPDNAIGWLGFSIFLLVSSLFWLIGIGTLISAINAGRRSAMLGVAEGQLFVERKSIFGTNWLEWPVTEVEKVVVGPSGTEINNIPVLELKIHDTHGKQHGMLSQIPNDDLNWIAQELGRSLQSYESR